MHSSPLRFFPWLVGPMSIQEAEVDGQPLRSAVHIERCRCGLKAGTLACNGTQPLLMSAV